MITANTVAVMNSADRGMKRASQHFDLQGTSLVLEKEYILCLKASAARVVNRKSKIRPRETGNFRRALVLDSRENIYMASCSLKRFAWEESAQ
jgi:hypothetical protein